MESHYNTFAASTGLLGNLIQGCLAVSDFLERFEHADELANQYTARLQLHLSRLHWWSCRWKIIHDESPSNGIPDARFQMYGNAITNYLELILHTVRHLTSQQDSIPIFKNTRSAHASSASERFSKLLSTPWKEHSRSSTEPSHENISNFSERLKWALKNGSAMQRLELLEYLVRDLEGFFPPPGPSSDICGAVLVNPALTAEKGDWKLRWLSSQTEMDPFAASLAWLKATTISHINDLKLFPGYNPQRLHGMLIRDRCSTAARHYTGHYNGSPVLIEKKTVPSKANNDLIRPRIEKVVHLLQASQRIQELRTLPCIGYIYTQPGEGPLHINDENCTYEFLYTIHVGPAVSLRKLLSSESRKAESRKDDKYKKALSVGKRFEIARTLSRALLYLHAAEWIHKGIRSSSIMFVSSGQPISESKETDTSRLGRPYLVGFEYSRLASNDEGTENHATTVEDNLYRHPDAQGLETTDEESYISRTGRFTKDHDIYSLGVTLVEMGVYKSAKRIAAEFQVEKSGHVLNAESFRRFMIDTLIPQDVTFNMGEVYAGVAIRCLEAGFYSLPGRNGQDGSIAFYKEVVSQLELCRA
ncbi:hypothetical protein CNMCM6936_000968 [Aspergillus lentulus]|nr:hypothetical protein CNMCM6069_001159 [Aspergillus lentulus]KAF4163291.1 hypothetical protein CNMCM6936_000968 [Aspergillus lentulus]